MNKFIYLALSLVSLLSFASCGDEDEKEVSKVEIPEEVSSLDYATLYELGLNYPLGSVSLIDLGLSVKWASKNVGALDFYSNGSYFAWGETKTKDEYSLANSDFVYKSINELYDEGVIDNSGNLTFMYDAATAWNVLYRMPTAKEFSELKENCDFYNMTIVAGTGEKVAGFYVKSKINGNAIFLPVTGMKAFEKFYNFDFGQYWSSTACQEHSPEATGPYLYYAYYCQIYGEVSPFRRVLITPDIKADRYDGRTIRAVENK